MRKVLKYLVPILLTLISIYIINHMNNEYVEYKSSELNNKVIKIEYSYSAGLAPKNYHLDNGVVFTFDCESDCIVLGDSIVKEHNTTILRVYRQVKNDYKFQNSYDTTEDY